MTIKEALDSKMGALLGLHYGGFGLTIVFAILAQHNKNHELWFISMSLGGLVLAVGSFLYGMIGALLCPICGENFRLQLLGYLIRPLKFSTDLELSKCPRCRTDFLTTQMPPKGKGGMIV